MDMAKLLSLFKDEDDTPKASSCDMCGGDHGLDEDCAVEEGFEDATTEPDPEFRDTKYMTKDLAGGLNKEKRSFGPAAGADNPMALEDDDLLENKIRAELKALYKL